MPAVYSGFDEIGMNTGAATASGQPIGNGNPVLKDVRVRQAINYAIDRPVLVSRVLDGYGSAGSSIIPPIYANQHYTPTTDAMNYDPAKANQILDAAGYKKDSHGIRVNPKTGKEISLRLFARSDSQSSQQSVQFVQNWLQAIGFKIDVKVLSEDNLDQIIGDGEYDLFEFGWVVEPDPDYQLSTMTCAQRSSKSGNSYIAGLSDSFFCNSQYDKLYDQQKTQINPAQRLATVKAAREDRVRRCAVRRHLLLRRPRGLPHRPVHRMGAAAVTRTARCCSSTAPGATRTSARSRRRPAPRRPGPMTARRSSCSW